MVDGAVLLVDAVEGPLAQTKFVLAKALSRGLAPVVVLNKVDRPAATQSRCDAVASQLFDLFASLGADDRQLDFPVLYASAKQVCGRGVCCGMGVVKSTHCLCTPCLAETSLYFSAVSSAGRSSKARTGS
jgi:hypothetical protein